MIVKNRSFALLKSGKFSNISVILAVYKGNNVLKRFLVDLTTFIKLSNLKNRLIQTCFEHSSFIPCKFITVFFH